MARYRYFFTVPPVQTQLCLIGFYRARLHDSFRLDIELCHDRTLTGGRK